MAFQKAALTTFLTSLVIQGCNVFTGISYTKYKNKDMAHDNFYRYSTAAKIINYSGLIILFFLICISPHRLLYDERHHIPIATSIYNIGLIDTLKLPPTCSAPGPLFSFIQLSLISLTSLNPPWIRFINYGILLLIIVLLILIAKRLKVNDPVLCASTILVIPFMYPVAGMALTEIPALFFFTLFCLLFLKLMDSLQSSHVFSIVILAILAGLSLGVAIIGRQIYLCALTAVFIIFKLERNNLIAFLSVIISTIIASFWLFWIWGGLTPPGLNIGGISFKHGILSFAYLGFATCFICPEWIKLNKLIICSSIIVIIVMVIITPSI